MEMPRAETQSLEAMRLQQGLVFYRLSHELRHHHIPVERLLGIVMPRSNALRYAGEHFCES